MCSRAQNFNDLEPDRRRFVFWKGILREWLSQHISCLDIKWTFFRQKCLPRWKGGLCLTWSDVNDILLLKLSLQYYFWPRKVIGQIIDVEQILSRNKLKSVFKRDFMLTLITLILRPTSNQSLCNDLRCDGRGFRYKICHSYFLSSGSFCSAYESELES